MEGAPEEVSIDKVVNALMSHTDVQAVHDIHIWSITSGLHALSCHVVVDGYMLMSDASQLIHQLEHRLKDLDISHATIQVESQEHPHNQIDAVECGFGNTDC